MLAGVRPKNSIQTIPPALLSPYEGTLPGLNRIDEHHAIDDGDRVNPSGLNPPPQFPSNADDGVDFLSISSNTVVALCCGGARLSGGGATSRSRDDGIAWNSNAPVSRWTTFLKSTGFTL